MQAVILAGGYGTRLRPITHTIPKPMVEVGGRPFLHYIIELMEKNGIIDVVLLVGHLHEQIEAYFDRGEDYGVNIDYSVEEELLGTGGAVVNAREKLQSEFMVLNGDTYLPIDYRRLLRCWEQVRDDADGMLVVYDNHDSLGTPNVAAEDDQVTAYNKKNSAGMQYIDAGVQIFKRNVFDRFPVPKVISLEEEIFPELIERGRLAVYITDIRFYDMGTPERLKVFERYLEDTDKTNI